MREEQIHNSSEGRRQELDRWEEGYQNWVDETRQKIEVAVEQLDRGKGIDGEVVVERLRDKLRQARENQA